MTTFSDRVYQLGGQPVGAPGPMTFGKVFFVRPSTGSDGNSGKRPDQALATVTKAQTLCAADKGDIIYLISEGNAAGSCTSRIAAGGLNWNLDLVHLVGVNHSGSPMGPRARLSNNSTDVTTTILFTLSANSCYFGDLQILHGVTSYAGASAAEAVKVTGDRNVFRNCSIAGMGGTDGAMDEANACSLNLSSAGENYFEGCVIGLETTAKGTAANSEIRFESASARNMFKQCYIVTWAEAAGHQFVLVPASGLQGMNLFSDCAFINSGYALGPGAEMTEAMSLNATQNGLIVVERSSLVHAVDWADTDSVRVVGHANGNEGVLNTDSGGAA
jgi:hypothetical protein